MRLQSERLTLREINVDDIPLIHQLNSFPEVDKYNTLGLPESIEDTEKIIHSILEDQKLNPKPRYVYRINDLEGNFIGLIGIVLGKPKYFTAEIWYKLLPSNWNKGFASEALKCVLRFCFTELKLHRITAGCATQNIASIKVLEKNGFIREGYHRKVLPIRGEWIDNYEYAFLEEDYLITNKGT